MIKKELIEKLEKLPDDTPICICVQDDDEYNFYQVEAWWYDKQTYCDKNGDEQTGYIFRMYA